MIYTFKISSQESPNFLMEVKMNENHSFLDFHTLIQNELGFESHQLASFFITDGSWRKLKEISMLDMGTNNGAFYIMQKTKLVDLINAKNQNLIYTFDFFNDRSLYIELTGIIMEKNLNEPLVTLKQGDAPVQVLGDEDVTPQEQPELQQEEVYMDFGELDDYTEIFGEMDDF